MKISVVIPAYNEEKYLENCLKSLKKQTVKPDEIIVVDNNSTDKTSLVARKYKTRIIKEKKRGMIFARNSGFENASFEIIARCDADSILPSDWLEKIKINFKKYKIDALSGNLIFYDNWFLKNKKIFSLAYFKFLKKILGHYVLAGPAMALSKKIWKKVKNEVCVDEKKVHEDVDLSIHIAKYGKIAFDPNWITFTSARRINQKPFSFFVEYPWRLIKTIYYHKI